MRFAWFGLLLSAKWLVAAVPLPLYFEPNLGQFPPEIRFMAQGVGIGIADHALVFGSGARIRFARPASAPRGIEGLDKQIGTSSYFPGSDESKWIRNVPSFARVRIHEIYPGIDIVFHAIPGQDLEYDLIVQPGSDPGQIRIDFDPALHPRQAADGSVNLRGMRHTIPLVHQDGTPVRYSARLRQNSLRFEIPRHDRSKPLVIDPVVVYSVALNFGTSAFAVDAEGAFYLTGTSSYTEGRTPFFTTHYSYFVSKIRATPDQGVYSREYTINLGDFRTNPGSPQLAVDAVGGAYLAGTWPNASLPVKNAFRPTFNNAADGFVAKIGAKPGPAGYMIEYASYTGAPISAIAASPSGSAYLASATGATLPTLRAFQASLSGPSDIYLMRVNAAPTTSGVYELAYATYLGGREQDSLRGLAVDAEGALYLTGYGSAEFPYVNAPPDLFKPPFGFNRPFLAKISASQGASGNYELVYSLPIGSTSPMDLAVDPMGSAVVIGSTQDRNLPAVRALTPHFPVTITLVPPIAGFLLRIASKPDTAGRYALVYSSYIDGTGPNYIGDNKVAVDGGGNVWFSGLLTGGDFPVLDPLWNSGDGVFLAKYFIPETGIPSPIFRTPLAPTNRASLIDLAVEPASGAAYILASGDLGSRGSAFNSIQNLFAMKIDASSATAAIANVTIRSTQYSRIFTTSGSGCEPGEYKTPAILNWTRGATCRISFTMIEDDPIYKSQHRFKTWENGSTDPVRTLIVPTSGPVTLTATHEDWVLINLAVVEGSGSVSSPGDGKYWPSGTEFTVTATPGPGFVFEHWDLPLNSGRATAAATTLHVGGFSATASAHFSPALDSNWSPSQFVPVAPCRLADTRVGSGPANGTREFAVAGLCNIPQNASAYSINVTVIPKGTLGYLTVFPAGPLAAPNVSTLNSLDGRIKASAAIVGAGAGGQIAVYSAGETDVVIDINGYFTAPKTGSLAYYPVAPCRFFDTRSNATGGPALKALITRTINIAPLPACGIPSTAQAYVLNATVAPASKLGYLRILPAGAPASSSATSTLNALTGTVVANTAIVGAGEQGAIDVFAIDDTHLILDVNGYFAPPGEPGGLNYYPVKPCRLLDSRLSPPLYGFPKLTAYAITPNQPLACIPPAAAKAWSLNATVLPTDGPLGWFALGPGDIYYYNYKPLFSTLNALDGGITANAVIVEAPGRYLSIFLSDSAHLILDLNGFFAQ